MAVELAANHFEALVRKVDADLNNVMQKVSNEFSESVANGFNEEMNPVKLIERLEKAKHEYKNLMQQSAEIESKQKEVIEELWKLVSAEMNIVCKLQLQSGMQLNLDSSNEEIVSQLKATCMTENLNATVCHADFQPNLNGTKSTNTCRSIRSDFEPLTEDEFMSVSDLIRGRSKLADVNQVYSSLFAHFKKNRKIRYKLDIIFLGQLHSTFPLMSMPSHCSDPAEPQCQGTQWFEAKAITIGITRALVGSCLTLKDMTKLGLKVSGATGSAKLKVLRSLNIIEINKDGGVKML